MGTKKIEIEIPEGKKAEWINGVLTLVDESQKDNRPVTERIKTFEDARSELGSAHPLVEEYETITCRCGGLSTDILAYMKLRIICTALNEGREPHSQRMNGVTFLGSSYTPKKESMIWMRTKNPVWCIARTTMRIAELRMRMRTALLRI